MHLAGRVEAELYPLASDMDPALRASVRELLRRVEERPHRPINIDHLFEEHEAELVQIWAAFQGTELTSVGVTRVVEYPDNTRVMYVEFGAGELSDFLTLESVMVDLAREAGCCALRAAGRPGWARALPHWREITRTIERKI